MVDCNVGDDDNNDDDIDQTTLWLMPKDQEKIAIF